jgi:outer membrane murein-binding lipoprotein Lpp
LVKLAALCTRQLAEKLSKYRKKRGTIVFRNRLRSIGLMILVAVLLTGCGGASKSDPAASAVENYLKALAGRDLNQMIANACTAWEAQARQEYDSFAAVSLELKEVSCKSTGQDQSYTLVDCTGSIIANYGNEDLQIDVADQTFQVVQEAGDWRVCGYQGAP